MEVPNIDNLTPLTDFPGYYIDLKSGNVWSHLIRGREKEPTWKCRKPQRGCQLVMTCNYQVTRVSIGRLVASAKLGVSYWSLPQSLAFGKDVKDALELTTKAALRKKEHFNRVKELRKNSIEDVKRAIHTMQLLLAALEGDSSPLLEYVTGEKDTYCQILLRRRFRKELVYDAYEYAFDLLISQLNDPTRRMYDIDSWMVAKMAGYIRETLKNKVTWKDYYLNKKW